MAATAQSETLLGTPATDDYRSETPAPPAAARRPKALYVLGGLLAAAAVAVAGFYVHGLGRRVDRRRAGRRPRRQRRRRASPGR